MEKMSAKRKLGLGKMNKQILPLILCTTLIAPFSAAAELGADWLEATSTAAWGRLFTHSTVSYEGKLWVLGGADAFSVPLDNVWSSTDGTSWTLVNSAAPWGVRQGHTSTVYNGRMWVIGGGRSGVRSNDVWSSTDGVNWVEATSSASWAARDEHASIVFDDKIWVIGGAAASNSDFLNDVWSSSDGVSWTEVSSAAPWSPRYQHTSAVHDGKIWVMGGIELGGTQLNDIWSSSDAVNWNEETSSAPWLGRGGATSVVFGSKIWVLGGTRLGGYFNDVWYSTDGTAWTQSVASAAWPARYHHTSVVHNGRMWVLGGINGSGALADVWHSQDLEATIDMVPDRINTKSKGRWLSVIITLPPGSSAEDIDVNTVAITGLSGASCDPNYLQFADLSSAPVLGDHDEDGIPDLAVRFDRQLLQPNLCMDDTGIVIEGELVDGSRFVGQDSIQVFTRGRP